jgi:hypothetical protein
MTLQTWKEEFYPIDAKYVSKEDAVEHSLRKWIGLRAENLSKHGVNATYSRVYDGDGVCGEDEMMYIDDESCALCVHYIENECSACPLFGLLGRSCDKGDEIISEYASFVRFGNPEPMITALERLQNGEHNE